MTQLKEFADSIEISEEEAIPFLDAWDILMLRFQIPQEHHGMIFYTLKSFFSNLEKDNLNYYDITNSISALDFFISFLQLSDIAKSKSKLENLNRIIDNSIKLQIQSKYPSSPVTFNYPGVTQYVVNYLYKTMRSSDPMLLYPFGKYKEIPSLEILQEIRDGFQYNLDNPFHYNLLDTISTLQEFLNANLAKELSRKQHLFIFELLYLFNLLKYAGKVDNTQAENYALDPTKTPDRKFAPTLLIPNPRKIAIIKAVIKNSKRNSRYYNSK